MNFVEIVFADANSSQAGLLFPMLEALGIDYAYIPVEKDPVFQYADLSYTASWTRAQLLLVSAKSASYPKFKELARRNADYASSGADVIMIALLIDLTERPNWLPQEYNAVAYPVAEEELRSLLVDGGYCAAKLTVDKNTPPANLPTKGNREIPKWVFDSFNAIVQQYDTAIGQLASKELIETFNKLLDHASGGGDEELPITRFDRTASVGTWDVVLRSKVLLRFFEEPPIGSSPEESQQAIDSGDAGVSIMDSKKEGKAKPLVQIFVAVTIAMIAGSTAPWWWSEVKDLFGRTAVEAHPPEISGFTVAFSVGTVGKEGAEILVRLADAAGGVLVSNPAGFARHVPKNTETDTLTLPIANRLALKDCQGLRLLVTVQPPDNDPDYADHWQMEPRVVAILVNGERVPLAVVPPAMREFFTSEAAARHGLPGRNTSEEWELECKER